MWAHPWSSVGGTLHNTVVLGRSQRPSDSKGCVHSRGSVTCGASERERWPGLAPVPAGSKATLSLKATLQGTAPPPAGQVTVHKTIHLRARFPHLSCKQNQSFLPRSPAHGQGRARLREESFRPVRAAGEAGVGTRPQAHPLCSSFWNLNRFPQGSSRQDGEIHFFLGVFWEMRQLARS